jgi:DNA (cytosine-5)-methyltransferase 1
MSRSSRRKPTVISLFSGAGGLDYGLEAAGFETRIATDIDPDSCATLRANRHWPVIEDDVFSVPAAALLETGELSAGEADLLVGGPPCQPFSKSGYWASGDSLRLEDPRAATLLAFMRIWQETLPKVVLLENVRGFAYRGKSEALDFILDAVRHINATTESAYRPALAVLQAADYGVPQLRERFFLVAARDGRKFVYPPPTHCDLRGHTSPLVPDERRPWTTAWDAIGNVQPAADEDLEVRGKWASLLPSIPEGENYLFHTERGAGLPLFGWRRRYWSFLLKLAKNRPSWTVQAQPGPAVGPFHWTSRRLSLRELSRLQTFPDDVNVVGSRTSAQRQIGNAVPSLLTEVLGRAIRDQLLGEPVRDTPLTLLPAAASVCPRPEDTTPVPDQYLHLVGHDTPHPGNGKGRAAIGRQR